MLLIRKQCDLHRVDIESQAEERGSHGYEDMCYAPHRLAPREGPGRQHWRMQTAPTKTWIQDLESDLTELGVGLWPTKTEDRSLQTDS